MFKSLFRKQAPTSTVGSFAVARGVDTVGAKPIERRSERTDRRKEQLPFKGEDKRIAKSGRGLRATDGQAKLTEVGHVSEVMHVVPTTVQTGTGTTLIYNDVSVAEHSTKTPMMQLVPDTGKHKAASRAEPIAVQREADLMAVLNTPIEGILQGVVAHAASGECVCLYLGCGQVAVVMVESFSTTLHCEAVAKAIDTDWMYQVHRLIFAPSALVVALRDKHQLKANQSPSYGLTYETRLKRIYVDIIEASARMGVSDIHARTRGEVAEVLIRLDGTVHHWLRFKKQLLLDALSAGFSFVTPGTSTTEQWKATEDQAFMTHHNVTVEKNGKPSLRRIEARYNHAKYLLGVSAVIRLLDTAYDLTDIPTLEQLGYGKSVREMLTLAMLRKWGLIIFVGSTGQGKSTTIRTIFTYLPDAATQIVYTAEEPAEYPYQHAIQISIPSKADDSTESRARKQTAVVRNFLRMDPDRGMVGEIRDAETAKMAIEFVQTGHPGATTLHGDSTIDGLSRLTGDSLKVPAQDLGNAKLLNTVVYQVLVSKLCETCKLPATDSKYGLTKAKKAVIREKFQLDPDKLFVANPNGCEHCRPRGIGLKGNGTKGRVAAVEIFMPDFKAKAMIAKRDWSAVTRYWRSQRVSRFDVDDARGKTALENGLFLVSQGIVSPLSLEAEVEPFELYEVQRVEADGVPA